LGFVSIVWMLITFIAVGRAVAFGWNDQIAWTFLPLSLGMLLLVVIKRGEILKSRDVPCPRCGAVAKSGQYRAWQFLVAVCFFPLGMLALLAGHAPTTCKSCGTTWQT
jgi:hypothetical protein